MSWNQRLRPLEPVFDVRKMRGSIQVGNTPPGPPPVPIPSDMVLWLDATDAATITDAGSGAVSAWADKSSSGLTFTQATGTNRPTTGIRTINGLNVLNFDGSNDVLTGGDVLDLGTADFTTFTVLEIDLATARADHVWGKIEGPPSYVKGYGLQMVASGSVRFRSYMHTGSVQSSPGGARPPTSTPQLATGRLARASAHQFRVNGSAVAAISSTSTVGVDVTTAADFMIGFSTAAGAAYFDGAIGEIIVYHRALTDSERDQVEAYLIGKWNL